MSLIKGTKWGSGPRCNETKPYYKKKGAEYYIYWMWHENAGHWVLNEVAGIHAPNYRDIMRSKLGEFACPQHKTEWEVITQTDFKISSEISGFECGPRLTFSGFLAGNAHLNGLWTLALNGNGKLLTTGCATFTGMNSNNQVFFNIYFNIYIFNTYFLYFKNILWLKSYGSSRVRYRTDEKK